MSEDDLRQAARTFAKAENGLVLYGLESGGDESLQAAIRALVLLTGHAGKANSLYRYATKRENDGTGYPGAPSFPFQTLMMTRPDGSLG